MKIVRSHLLFALVFGSITSSLGNGSVIAQEVHTQAAAHDQQAMEEEKQIAEALADLSPEDRKQVSAQRFCPVMQYTRLGATGTPIQVIVKGKPVFVCCEDCVEEARKGGDATLKTVKQLTDASAALKELPARERAAVEAQKYCAIANSNLLGSMGVPIKLQIDGKPVYLCCKGCVAKAQANPAAALAKAEELKEAGMHEDEGHDHSGHEHDDGDGDHEH